MKPRSWKASDLDVAVAATLMGLFIVAAIHGKNATHAWLIVALIAFGIIFRNPDA